jgi:V8-like Glu-specific endopeptidase
MKSIVFAFLSGAFTLFPHLAWSSDFAVYGPDDRKNLYEIQDDQMLRLADASVALFKMWDLGFESAGKVPVSSTPLKESQNLCSGQAFEDEPTAPYCSGSLIAPDIVMTAGHCVKNTVVCWGIRIAFGYAVQAPDVMPDELWSGDVYRCKEVIESQSDDDGPDFALIRLDRPVVGHKPLKLDKKAKQKVGDPVFAIGYPSGLPLKVAGNARIRSVEEGYFISNLDTFVGNSGSPVFNAKTGLVEGILVSGDDDYVPANSSCKRIKHCKDDRCSGETATSISEVLPYL